MKKILLIMLLCFMSMNFLGMSTLSRIPEYKESITFDELNDSTLYYALVHYEIKYPRIVLAQAKLESSNYTSNNCVNKNNFLGLYNSKKKKYFEFDHWTDCIQAYKDMIEYKHRDEEDYYDFLIRIGYAEDPEYITKVKQIENNLN